MLPLTVVIDLTGVSDIAPVFDLIGPFSVDENSAPGTPIGTVTATDGDVEHAEG